MRKIFVKKLKSRANWRTYLPATYILYLIKLVSYDHPHRSVESRVSSRAGISLKTRKLSNSVKLENSKDRRFEEFASSTHFRKFVATRESVQVKRKLKSSWVRMMESSRFACTCCVKSHHGRFCQRLRRTLGYVSSNTFSLRLFLSQPALSQLQGKCLPSPDGPSSPIITHSGLHCELNYP